MFQALKVFEELIITPTTNVNQIALLAKLDGVDCTKQIRMVRDILNCQLIALPDSY